MVHLSDIQEDSFCQTISTTYQVNKVAIHIQMLPKNSKKLGFVKKVIPNGNFDVRISLLSTFPLLDNMTEN